MAKFENFESTEIALLHYHFFVLLKTEQANWHMKNVSRKFEEWKRVKLSFCKMCGSFGFCFAVPTYSICEKCIPNWHEIQVRMFRFQNPLERWKWEDIIKTLRPKNLLTTQDSVEHVGDKQDRGTVAVRKQQESIWHQR